ncbi:sensor histidine kinase [Rhizobium sp. LjRoot254]|uniref:sensor histidine kinase n=1 Tax=Rhizobium sp. LjRoot254 TaxID=3342297 RepID=UPI003ECD4CE2
MVQRFLWHAQDLKEDRLNSFFISALVDMRASLILQDEEGSYLCVTSLPDCWTVDRNSTPGDTSIFGPEIAAQLSESRRRAQRTGNTDQIEVRLAEDRIFEFRVLSVLPRVGDVQMITTIIDRTEDRRREKVLQQLLREVSHRSKNLLAIIQSIATQTSQHADSIEAYVQKFRGRIFSLSRSQDLITDSGWRGAYIRELLEQQVGSYVNGNIELVRFEGVNTLLSPNAAMHLGLAFHELVINTITHGTILKTNDTINVQCSLKTEDGVKRLQVVWNEPIARDRYFLEDRLTTPKSRFGRAILERVVPISVNGAATYSITDTGIKYTLNFPVDIDESLRAVPASGQSAGKRNRSS